MRLTEAAAERTQGASAASGKEIAGVRIGVKNGGCAGMEYTMQYADAPGPHDELIEDKGVKLLIDPTAVMFLLGTEMDYRTDKHALRLRVQQPEPDDPPAAAASPSRSSPRRSRPSRRTQADLLPRVACHRRLSGIRLVRLTGNQMVAYCSS